MAGNISNLEIFSAGTWTDASGRKTTFTEQDLDGMVESFNALHSTNIVKPHLKLGHQDAQKWFGQRTGVPALGWVQRVWRQGSKLMADVINVPDALINLIKQRRYHNVSIEILPPGTIEHDGKKFGNVLTAIALLGTEMPAVKNLAGLAAALFNEQPAAFADGVHPVVYTSDELEQAMFTQEQVDALIEAAVNKAVTAAKAEFSSSQTAKDAEITVLKQRADGAEAQVTELKGKLAFQDAEKVVDKAIADGKLLPKNKERAMAFMTMDSKLKFGGVEKTPAEVFSDFLGDLGKQVDLKEKGNSDGKEAGQFSSAAAEVDAKVREAINAAGGAAKLSYSDAMTQVLEADADLKARYSAAL